MNRMLETGAVKIKVERVSEEDERINDRITSNSNTCTSSEKSEMSKSEIVDNSETQTEVCKAASHEKVSVKEKVKTFGSSSQRRKESEALEMLIKTEVEEEELEEN